MRTGIFILIGLAGTLCCQAQSADYRDSAMWKRWDESRNKAVKAINSDSSGKRTKKDPSLVNDMATKTFDGGTLALDRKVSDISAFAYGQKDMVKKYDTRSFLGIKNPWFGKKSYQSDEASLFSKTLMDDDKKFSVKKADAGESYLADKTAPPSREIVETKTYEPTGKTPGTLQAISKKMSKEMTIEQVRDLLNKN